MTLWRRVSAGFCALVLVVVLVAFPLRAYAMTATMAAVGGAVVVSAALAACGIYPYISEDGQTFGEWGAERLSDLWQQYVNSFEGGSLPSGGTVQTFEQIKAYITGQTLVISRSVWETLQSFVSWVKQTFFLTNNQTGANLGVVSGGVFYLPVLSDSSVSYADLVSGGLFIPGNAPGRSSYVAATFDKVGVAVVASASSNYPSVYFFAPASYVSTNNSYNHSEWVWASSNVEAGSSGTVSKMYFYEPVGGMPYKAFKTSWVQTVSSRLSELDSNVPVFSSSAEMNSYILSVMDDSYQPSSGVTADTSTLGALPDIAADADYMGLAVSPGTVEGVTTAMTPQAVVEGVTTAMTPQAVQEIIQQGVTERERPVVSPVEVQLATGVEIDAGTGVITDTSPVVIAPDTFPLSPGDYAIPSLSTVFPFSVPWDIARIFQALDAEPRFPLEDFTFTLDVPFLFGDSPPSVSLGLEGLPQELSTKINDTASLVRNLALIAACIGWLIFITKFIRF